MDRMQPINATAATYVLTAEGQSGTTIVVNRAAGSTFTLSAARGEGTVFDFLIGTTVTSNSVIIKVANSVDVMSGVALTAQDAGDTAIAFETLAASDTITLNGTTTGGIKGDRIILKDVASGLWSVSVISSGTGTEVTPFSATV